MSTPEQFGKGGRRAHFILAVLSLIYISDYADRFVISSMVSFIKADWGLTDTEVGLLTTTVLFFITAASLPASILIDRWSRRKTIAIMVLMWSAACLACRFARNFTELLLARTLLGIGEAGYAPAGTAMLAAAYPEEKRARMMGIWNISIPIGMGLGMIGGGLIARSLGWQHAFGIVALPGFLLAIAAWFMPDYKSVAPPKPAGARGEFKSFIDNSLKMLKGRALLFTYLGFAMNVSCTTAMASWLPSYFERTGRAELGHGGSIATPIMALVLIGAPLGGFLADHLRKKRLDARLLVPSVSSLISAVFLFLAISFRGHLAELACFALYGISITMFIAPAAASTQDLVHPGSRALSYALCVIIQHIAGDVWSPTIVGAISDKFSLPAAMSVIPLYGLLAALFFYLGSRHYERDLSRVEKVELVEENK